MRKTRWIICLGILGLLVSMAAGCGEGEEADGGFTGAPLVSLHLEEAGLHVDVRSAPQPPRKGLVDIELRVSAVEGSGGHHDDGHGGHADEGHGGHPDEGHAGQGGDHHHGHHALAVGKESGLAIRVIPWMGEHGHGSNEVEAEEVEAGVYHARGVLFSMPGTWELKLAIEGIEGQATSASFQVLP